MLADETQFYAAGVALRNLDWGGICVKGIVYPLFLFL
jgi:hypothetical protein